MKKRFALALTALLPILAACSAQDAGTAAAPATTATPAQAAATAAPAEGSAPTATATETPAAAPAAPATSRTPVGPEPVAGTDYEVIENGQPFQPAAGKIEVAEIFNFVCPACARFQPTVAPWKAGLPSDVNFVYVPALFGGTWDDYARAFYAAQTLGIEEKTHDAIYRAIHVDHVLKGELGHDSVQDIAAVYAKAGGVDAKQFADTMGSFGVATRANRAKQFAVRSKITGTPSLVIDGKYLVKGRTYEDMLRIADHLIARERAAAGR